jgi:hypothetical protein
MGGWITDRPGVALKHERGLCVAAGDEAIEVGPAHGGGASIPRPILHLHSRDHDGMLWPGITDDTQRDDHGDEKRGPIESMQGLEDEVHVHTPLRW